MRWGHVLAALLALTTCGRAVGRDAEDGGKPAVRVVGTVACATCPNVRMRIAGTELDRVVGAELVPRDGTPSPVPATTSVRLVPGARPELEVVASLRAPARPGVYDLRLRFERTGRDEVVLLRDALQVPADPSPSAGVVRSGE